MGIYDNFFVVNWPYKPNAVVKLINIYTHHPMRNKNCIYLNVQHFSCHVSFINNRTWCKTILSTILTFIAYIIYMHIGRYTGTHKPDARLLVSHNYSPFKNDLIRLQRTWVNTLLLSVLRIIVTT